MEVVAFLRFGSLLHCANVQLLFVLTKEFYHTFNISDSTTIYGAVIGALVYGVHPLRVEVVAWASCLPYICCLHFSLWALLAHLFSLRHTQNLRILAWRFLSVVLLLCAGLCKSVAVPFAGVMALLDFVFSRSASSDWSQVVFDILRSVTRNIGHFFVAALIAYLQWTAQARLGVAGSVLTLPLPPSQAVPLAAYSVWWTSYMSLPSSTIWAGSLAPLYPYPYTGISLWDPLFAVPLLIVTCAIVISCYTILRESVLDRTNKKAKFVGCVAILCFFVLLTPSLISPHGARVVACDRHTYIPCIVVAPLCVLLCSWLLDRFGRATCVGFCVVCYAVLVAETRQAIEPWGSEQQLWNHTLSTFKIIPPSFLKQQRAEYHQLPLVVGHHISTITDGMMKLASVLTEADSKFSHHPPGAKRAAEILQDVLELSPHSAKAKRMLAHLYLEHRPAQAEALLLEAVADDPTNPLNAAAYLQLGRLQITRNRLSDALTFLKQGEQLSPNDGNIQFQIGHILQISGRAQEAIFHYERASQLLSPYAVNFATLHKNFGILLAGLSPMENIPALPRTQVQPKRAVRHLRQYAEASQSDPDLGEIKRLIKDLEKLIKS
eukprot:c12435_g1_i3.p1 GENE.c12435_g1_i3~~c12435_g1_i3.p1  ORF type:complete len:606 (+),score=63.70 c12435_g1_i3:391-2208(+)